MNKLTMSRWALGLCSMMLGALAVGCVGAPVGEEEEESATEAPVTTTHEGAVATRAAGDDEAAAEASITRRDRAANTAELTAKMEAEGADTTLKDVPSLAPGSGGGPELAVRVHCLGNDINNACCFFFDDGTVICIPPA